MFSFTSNFKKFRNIYRLLGVILVSLAGAMTVNTVIYRLRMNKEAEISEERIFDDFFGRKCLPGTYPVIIYGDSRSYNGISPEAVSGVLHRPAFNAALSSGGMNDQMMKFIDRKIDRKSPKPVIILGITPYSLTENARKNECFLHYSAKLRSAGNSMLLNTSGPGWLDTALMPTKELLTTGSLRNGKLHRDKNYTKRYHDNGWVETTVISRDTSDAMRKTLEMYETRDFENNPLSRRSMDELINWIGKWSEEGITVVAFRPPTCREMEEIEDRKTRFPSLDIARKIHAAGGIWLDIPESSWESYDASHLTGQSADKLSRLIAEKILSSEN